MFKSEPIVRGDRPVVFAMSARFQVRVYGTPEPAPDYADLNFAPAILTAPVAAAASVGGDRSPGSYTLGKFEGADVLSEMASVPVFVTPAFGADAEPVPVGSVAEAIKMLSDPVPGQVIQFQLKSRHVVALYEIRVADTGGIGPLLDVSVTRRALGGVLTLPAGDGKGEMINDVVASDDGVDLEMIARMPAAGLLGQTSPFDSTEQDSGRESSDLSLED